MVASFAPGVSGLNLDGDRVTHHHSHVGEDAADFRAHKAFVARTDVENFNGIGDGGAVVSA